MTRILGLFVALAAFAGAAVAGDCKDCTAAKLCDAHAAADKEAAKALRAGLAKPEAADRVAAIEAFAAACAEHANCRPAANAQLLAAAMSDPDGSVRGKAAAKLGEQDAKVAGPLLAAQCDPLNKKLEKEPKGTAEENAWLANYDFLKGICAGLAACGSDDAAGGGMAKLLASTRLKVLDAAAEAFPSMRSKLVPPAAIAAIDRVRFSKPGPDRDRTWVNLLKAWEAMTKAGLKAPDASDPSDAIRFVNECKAWWKNNEKTWK